MSLKKRVAVVVDFDRVLFDTDRLYRRLVRAVQGRYGVSEAEFLGTLETSRTSRELYTPYRHARQLAEVAAKQPRFQQASQRLLTLQIHELLHQTVQASARAYVYRDANAFLEQVFELEKEWHLFLLSFGQVGYQRMKITAAGIEDWFLGYGLRGKNILVTQGSKATIMKALSQQYGRLIFCDDELGQLQEVGRALPECALVWMNRAKRSKVPRVYKDIRARLVEVHSFKDPRWRTLLREVSS